MNRRLFAAGLCLVLASCVSAGKHPSRMADKTDGRTSASLAVKAPAPATFDVRYYGAKGDGKTTDTTAINLAIDAAAAAGGGTVYFPAGTYLSFSIRLKSNIALFLDHGATILAADPNVVWGAYDNDPYNTWGDDFSYQDGGHSHWRNSLIWGENLHDISIVGSGTIDGAGLNRGDSNGDGSGNKILGLKLCRDVVVRGIKMVNGGHFCILPTGVDNLIIDSVLFDTNRDAIDIDCCKNVTIVNCKINSPNDDGLVLKSTFALGYLKPTENVVISDCLLFGYDVGALADGSFKKTLAGAPDRGGVTGRIKLGTESNGGFKNIAISNCVFDHCRGLALESVDGGDMEDISISNITMREVEGAPIFIRLGSRNRGPEATTKTGTARRINISNIVATDVDPKYCSMIMGIPGHDVEDVSISNVKIVAWGGGTKEQAAIPVPELEDGYPDPVQFLRPGPLPAYGFFIRHANGIRMNNIQVGYRYEDLRPAFILDDVKDADFFRVESSKGPGADSFVLTNVDGFNATQCRPIADQKLKKVEKKTM